MSEAIPSGWYPDPSNRKLVRWWDGSRWGPETAPKKGPNLALALPGDAAAESAGERAARQRSNRMWLLVAAVVLVAVAVLTMLT